MANEQKIDEFIDQRAFAQFERLQRELTENQTGMARLVQEARNLNRELGGARNITAFSQAQEKVTKSTQQMAQAQERVVKTSQQLAKAEDEVVKATQRNIVSSEEERRLLDSVSGSLEQNIRQRARLRGELSNVRQGLRVLNKETRGVTISTQKYDQRLRSLTDRETQLSAAIQQNTGTIRSQIRENQAAAGSYNQLNQRLIQLRAAYRELNPAERAQLAVGQQIIAQIRATDVEIKRLDASMGIHNRNVGNYGMALGRVVPLFRQFLAAFGVVGGIFIFAQAIRNAINVTRDFQKENAILAGVLDSSREEISQLTDEAIRLGTITAKTATEITGLQLAYARLGFTQREIIDLTEGTINGSIALNAELSETAALVGAMVRTFDDFSTQDTARILDIMTASTQQSALTFERLQTALPIVSGAANAAGVSFTEVVAILGRLSDAGIDASMSSTALRNILIESAAQGLSYREILDRIANSSDKLTASTDEFGKRAAVSGTVIANQLDTLGEFRDRLDDSGGVAERVAEEQLRTLDGAITLLQSAWEGLILSIERGDGILGRFAVNTIKFLTDLLINTQKEFQALSRFATETNAVFSGLGNVINNLGRIFQNSFRAIGQAIGEIDLDLLNPARTAASFDRAFQRLREGVTDNFTILEESYRLGYNRVIEEARSGQQALDNITAGGATPGGEPVAPGGAGGEAVEQQERISAVRTDIRRRETEDAIRLIEAEIEANIKAGIDIAEEQKRLAEIKQRFDDETTARALANIERRKEQERALAELGQELANFGFTVAQANVERERERLEERLEEIEIEKNAEIEAVNATMASEEEKAARIAIIESQKQAQRERIEREQRQLDLQRARFDKAQSISSIIVNTARAVVQALPNIPLSIIVGAIGAAQLATALAQPLPRFEKGTKSAPGGPAVVGEKGSELVVNPQGKLGITPSVPTLIDLQKGSQVIPNHELMNMIAQPQLLSMTSGQGIDVERIVKSQDSGTRRIEKALNGKKEHRTILTDRGLKGIYRNGHSWREYRGRNL